MILLDKSKLCIVLGDTRFDILWYEVNIGAGE